METVLCLAKCLVIMAAAAVLGGCGGSPSSRFYTLTPLSEGKPAPAGAANNVAVNVEPVEIPDYLDRPQIVTRTGGNEVKVAEFQRWAGSLSENVSDVLAEDLGQLLASDQVVVNNGAPLGKQDFMVSLRVLQLDCLPGNQVILRTQWKVASRDGKKATTRVSSVTEKVADTRYDTMVAAINRALHRVSREIAAEIPRLAPAAGGATLP